MADGSGNNPETPVGSHDKKPHLAAPPALFKPTPDQRPKHPPLPAPDIRAHIRGIVSNTVALNKKRAAAQAAQEDTEAPEK